MLINFVLDFEHQNIKRFDNKEVFLINHSGNQNGMLQLLLYTDKQQLVNIKTDATRKEQLKCAQELTLMGRHLLDLSAGLIQHMAEKDENVD